MLACEHVTKLIATCIIFKAAMHTAIQLAHSNYAQSYLYCMPPATCKQILLAYLLPSAFCM